MGIVFFESLLIVLFPLETLKENELLEPTEELCVVSEEIRTLDVRQSIDQLLRSLRLKCESLNKLPFNAFFEIEPITTDNTRVEGFDNLDAPPNGIEVSFNNGTKSEKSFKSNDQLLSMRISGQNDSKVGEDKKSTEWIEFQIHVILAQHRKVSIQLVSS